MRITIAILFFTLSFCVFGQTADFSSDVTNGCVPLVVNFSDESSGSTSWEWDFGKSNDNFSTNQNPSAIYTDPGVYSVKLTINDGASSITKTSYIEVFDDPTVDFTYGTTKGCTPFDVSFASTSTPGSGSIETYQWVFGDGNSSDEANPTNTYGLAGIYPVTLVVTNSKGCNSLIVKNELIEVLPLESDFDSDVKVSCSTGIEVAFTSTNEGPGTLSFHWDFGDGENSQVANPTHVYNTQGEFDVSLTVSGDFDCSIITAKENFITVFDGLTPDFSISPFPICVGEEITFTDITSGNTTDLKWDLGSGEFSIFDEKEVTKIFDNAGSYEIRLQSTLVEDDCSGTTTQSIEIRDLPDAVITHEIDCERNTVFAYVPSNSDAGEVVAQTWNLGDGETSNEMSPVHQYSSSSTYKVTLTLETEYGCYGEIEYSAKIPSDPIAAFLPNTLESCSETITLGGCAPYTITFQDESYVDGLAYDVEWSFGVGDDSSTAHNPSYTYSQVGEYDVQLKVINELGCTNTITKTVVVVDEEPTANFEIDVTEVCFGEPIQFTDLSENVTYWCWDFGDGTSTQQNPSYTFKSPGLHSVTLTVKNSGCPDMLIMDNVILVKDPMPLFEVNYDCDNPFRVYVEQQSQNVDEWQWDFGDDNEDAVDFHPEHIYDEVGNYTISLKNSNFTTGCVDIERQQIISVVDLEPAFSMDETSGCGELQVKFTDESEFAVGWYWDFGNKQFSSVQNPTAIYDTPGKYSVKLTVSDIHGCSKEQIKNDVIIIHSINGLFEKVEDPQCDQMVVTFTDYSYGDPPIIGWTWDFGDGQTSNVQHPIHAYDEVGEYNVSLTLENEEGSCTVVQEGFVNYKLPIPIFETEKLNYCIGESVSFTNVSENSASYLWEIIDEITSTDNEIKYAFSKIGSYDVRLTAIDENGCDSTIIKEDFIIITKPIAEFTADNIHADCPPLITNFIDNSQGENVNWYWDFGDGFTSVVETPAHTYLIPGDYDVTLIATDEYGCSDTTSYEQLVTLGGPYGTFEAESDVYCTSAEVKYTANAINTTIYTWDFGDGELGSGEVTSHMYKNQGKFSPELVLEDDNGCQFAAESTLVIDISPIPIVDFEYEPYPFEEEEILFTSLTEYSDHWYWEFGDGNVSDIKNPVHQFAEPGIYTITLTATSVVGCMEAIQKQVLVQGVVKFIPNVITPNEADPNDLHATNYYFVIPNVEYGTWDIDIFDRWGKTVFSKKDYDNSWYGEKEPGVYYYSLRNRYRDREFRGTITVLL